MFLGREPGRVKKLAAQKLSFGEEASERRPNPSLIFGTARLCSGLVIGYPEASEPAPDAESSSSPAKAESPPCPVRLLLLPAEVARQDHFAQCSQRPHADSLAQPLNSRPSPHPRQSFQLDVAGQRSSPVAGGYSAARRSTG